MNVFKRLLAASGAAGILVGLGGATQAFALAAGAPFTAQIALACVNGGQSQTITVYTVPDSVVHVEVSIGGSIVNGSNQTGIGVVNADGVAVFTDQWTVGTVSATTAATVKIYVLATDGLLAANGVAIGNGSFSIHPVSAPCVSPAPAPIAGFYPDVTQIGGSVKKTCDTGVTGNATFTATIQVKLSGQVQTTFSVPPALTLACNGDSKGLPVLPPTSAITLHESIRPPGAAAAADTVITVGTVAVTTTINNAKAAVVTTPTPIIVLPPTGQPASTPGIPWPAVALFGLIAIAGAGLVLRRRS